MTTTKNTREYTPFIEFCYYADSTIEKIGNKYNINFLGKFKNEDQLRDDLMNEIVSLDYEGIISLDCCVEVLHTLTTMQLIGLAIGSTYDEVRGVA